MAMLTKNAKWARGFDYMLCVEFYLYSQVRRLCCAQCLRVPEVVLAKLVCVGLYLAKNFCEI